MNSLRQLLVCTICLPLTACVTFAPPSPLVTLGGPQTTPAGSSELALAGGFGGARFPEGHGGGEGMFTRYRHGVSDTLDLGIDAAWASYSDKGVLSIKGSMRYQLDPHWRLEFGLGGADSSDGKSLNGDAAITCGTRREDRAWNVYATLRGGGAHGYAGDAAFGGGEIDGEPEVAPPDAWFGLVSLGAQARAGEHLKFVFEGGLGLVDVNHRDATGQLFYVVAGFLVDIHE
jgi:hypothetical protein